MTRTYVDAGTLIAAARGADVLSSSSMVILDDPARVFASSVFVRLEVLPKARYHGQRKEVAFYEAFFEGVETWADDLPGIVAQAQQVADRYGIAAMDALHVAAAVSAGAEELVTSERPQKPIHRVTELRVVTVYRKAGA